MCSSLRFPTLNIFLLISSILINNSSLFPFVFNNINLLTLIIIALWYIEIYFFEKHLDIPVKFILFLLCWWLYVLFLHIIGYSTAAIGNYYILLRFFDVVIKSVFVLRYYNNIEKIILATFVYLSIFSIIIENLYYLSIYGETYRQLYLLAAYTKDNMSGINFASTAFYNSLIFFIGVSFYQAMYSSRFIYKLFHYLCLLISYFFMFLIETRATSLFLSLLLILLIFYFSRVSSLEKIFYFYFFIIIVSLIPLWLPAFIDILPDRVAERCMALFYSNSDDDEGFLSRFELMSNSISSFASNVLFGVGDHRGHEYWHLIGQHSQIFDDLARYGFIGLLFIIRFYCDIYKYFTNDLSKSGLTIIAHSVLIVFFILCINSQAYSEAPALTAFLLLSTIKTSSKSKL